MAMLAGAAVEEEQSFVRIHQTLRVTPAMAAGVSTEVWEVEDIISTAGVKLDHYLAFRPPGSPGRIRGSRPLRVSLTLPQPPPVAQQRDPPAACWW